MEKLTSTVQFVEPNGTYGSPNGNTFNKYKVSFANGDQLNFLAKGEFKKKIGEEATYEKNAQYNSGKLVYEQPKQTFAPRPQAKSDDVQKLIVRQSSASTAATFLKNNNVEPSAEEIINLARQIEQYVYNG